MVFVYTEWCGFCRRMFNTTFKDQKVLGYLDEKFASVRINAESDGAVALPEQTLTESQVAQAMGVSGYPTIIFLDEKGGYITRLPGFLPPEDYIDVLTYIGDDHFKTESYEEHLAHGDG
jgi:thioredoxin-related protein